MTYPGTRWPLYFWPGLYIALIAAVNYGFSIVAPIPVMGALWPPMSLAVGLVFIVRDFAQRQIGHWVWATMIVAGILSYLMAGPYIAFASVAAFAIGETSDWAVYTFLKKPFAQRMIWSSVASSPLDSAVFLYFIGHLSVVGVALMTLSKLVGAAIVYALLRRSSPALGRQGV